MHVYIYYTWELSIFLDIKVCGCNSACVYSTVIVSLIYVILLGYKYFKFKKSCRCHQNSNYLLYSVV